MGPVKWRSPPLAVLRFICVWLAAPVVETSLLVAPAEVRLSPGKGLGAFAATSIDVGVCVGEYVGEVLTRSDVDQRYTATSEPPDYLFELRPGTLYVDARDSKHWSRYINHCEHGSLIPAAGDCTIQLYAARRIQAGEEYSFDYGLEYWATRDAHPSDDSRMAELRVRRWAARLSRASPQLALLSSTLLLPVLVPLLFTAA